ncbi:MAG: hypothetical protein NXI27_21490 [Alphaproteobacteria bacterium]|nr:hypothetical protein [Alphaproteobacteria bacterium]
MDLEIATGKGYRTRILERPGLWMKPDELSKLSSDLAEIASHTLKAGSLDYGVFSGDPQRLASTVITLVRRESDGRPIAFNALALMDIDLSGSRERVLHLGLVMVDPGEQSRGLSWVLYGLTCMMLFFRNQMRPIWISNVTQVPAIIGMVTETFSEVFPAPGIDRKRSLKHLLVARAIMRGHRHVFGVGEDADFDEARFVITNAYTGGSDELKKTFDEAPKHRTSLYNEFCEQQLDYQRGDDVLQLGRIDLPAIRRYLLETVPRRSVLALVLTTAFVTLQRLLLPLLYWTDSSRPWGILRARTNDR